VKSKLLNTIQQAMNNLKMIKSRTRVPKTWIIHLTTFKLRAMPCCNKVLMMLKLINGQQSNLIVRKFCPRKKMVSIKSCLLKLKKVTIKQQMSKSIKKKSKRMSSTRSSLNTPPNLTKRCFKSFMRLQRVHDLDSITPLEITHIS
jgi:hypothetical protein